MKYPFQRLELPLLSGSGRLGMSHDQEQDIDFVINRLREKVRRLMEQQTAAENMATLIGMTSEDSEQYKKRHMQIKNLTKKLEHSTTRNSNVRRPR